MSKQYRNHQLKSQHKKLTKIIKTIYLYQKIEYNKRNFCLFHQIQKEGKK